LKDEHIRPLLYQHILSSDLSSGSWDLFKSSIHFFFELHPRRKRNSWKKVDSLNKEIISLKKLLIHYPNSADIIALITKKEYLRNTMTHDLSEYWRIRSRANWIDKGEKSTKYFFQRFHVRSSDSFSQHFLRKNQGASSTDALLTARAFIQMKK